MPHATPRAFVTLKANLGSSAVFLHTGIKNKTPAMTIETAASPGSEKIFCTGSLHPVAAMIPFQSKGTNRDHPKIVKPPSSISFRNTHKIAAARNATNATTSPYFILPSRSEERRVGKECGA